jgi:alpha-beta hydrolase superfamily lysophospholipase
MNRITGRSIAVSIALAVTLLGCANSSGGGDGTGDKNTEAKITEAKNAESPKTAKPGTLTKSVAAPAVSGGTAAILTYHSQKIDGSDTVTNASLFVPARVSGTDPIPIVAYGHGTLGLGDDCAPTKLVTTSDPVIEEFVGPFLNAGFAVVVADYEGLGSPGEHPYALGESEGRNVLDAVRAAQRADIPGLNADSPVLGVGHSQGGGAVLFAAEIAPTYAPDVKLAGVVAQAPASQLETAWLGLREVKTRGYIVMLASAILAAYPDVPRSDVVTDSGMKTVERIRSQCADPILPDLSKTDLNTLLPNTISPSLQKVLRANTPGYRRPQVPVMIVHGTSDEQVPVAYSRTTADLYRALGADVRLVEFPTDHNGVVPASGEELLKFAAEVLG